MTLKIIIHLLLLVATISALIYRDCETANPTGTIECLTFSGCRNDSADVCELTSGSIVNIGIDFKLRTNVSDLLLRLSLVRRFGIDRHIGLNTYYICRQNPFLCLIVAGKRNEFAVSLKIGYIIEADFDMPGVIQVEAVTRQHETIFCFQIDGKLKPFTQNDLIELIRSEEEEKRKKERTEANITFDTFKG